MSRRTDRVGDLIRAELSDLLLREVSDPRIRMVTVTEVEVTADLSNAKVAVSMYGTEEEREECLAGLRRAAGFLRGQLGRRLTLRRTPELSFRLDRGAEHSARIAEILETLDHDDDKSS
jgi:ribosome-binding factor A